MEEVKLFGFWPSPFSRRVEMALKLKWVEYEYIEEDLANFNKSSELLHYNPIHKKVPVLIHNGKPIAESSVILEYIEETWNASYPLLPSNPYTKAESRFWANFISEVCVPTLWKACATKDAELITSALSHLSKLEEELKGKRFFGGEAISLVDLTACLIAHWLEPLREATGMKTRLVTSEKFPRLAKWSEDFCDIDVVKELLPEREKMVGFLKDMFAPPVPNGPPKYMPEVARSI